MANKKYWQSFGELNRSKALKKLSENEFQEELPFVPKTEAILVLTNSPQGLSEIYGFHYRCGHRSSCETPVNKMIPYLNKPQDLVPGLADIMPRPMYVAAKRYRS